MPTRSNRLRRRTLNIARYRHAVILGAGTDLVKEWCSAQLDPPNRRDHERSALRDFLDPALVALCEERVNTPQARNRPELEKLLRGDAESGHEPKDRELELREVFQITALHELEKLGAQTGWLRRADDRSLTRTAIQLSKQCVKVRLDYTRTALNSSDAAAELTRDELRNRANDALPNGGWRPPTWAEHYNAGSLYALGITCGAPNTEHEKLADAAIKQLRRAVAAADSAYVVSRHAWLGQRGP